MSSNNSEIEKLREFEKEHAVSILKLDQNIIDKDLSPVLLKINGQAYIIQIQDEYGDIEHNNSILNLLLVLRELSYVEDSTDFSHWCKMNGLNAENEQLSQYYTELESIVDKVSRLYAKNEINYYISDLDYQLGSGPMSVLRSL